MFEGLRAEFPEVGRVALRLRGPAIAREPLGWAFLSAAGAGFMVGGILTLVAIVLWPILFPPTEPHPEWLTFRSLTTASAAIAIGAVAIRARGPAALALYALYELAQILVQLYGRQLACRFDQNAPPPPLGLHFSCDLSGLIVDRWPIWLALAIGALASRWVIRESAAGANTMLRGAGVFAVAVTLATTAYGILTIATLSFRGPYFDVAFTAVYVVGELIAGALAGLLLRRAPSAAAVLVAVVVLSGLAATLPLTLAQMQEMPKIPLELRFINWAGVLAPLLGAAAILVARFRR